MAQKPSGLLAGRRFKLSPEFIIAVSSVLVWRVSLELVNKILVPLMNYAPNLFGSDGIKYALANWFHWDGSWYLYVTNDGYHYYFSNPPVTQNIVFFPAYPLFVRATHYITGLSNPYSGLALNVLVCMGIAYIAQKLYMLFKDQTTNGKNKKKDKDTGFNILTVALILSFPTAFFLISFYADALLLFFALGAIYFALKNRYVVAGIFAGLASGTKITGIIVAIAVIAIFIEHKIASKDYVNKKGSSIVQLFGITVLSVSGLLGYMTYLYFKFNNAFVFYSDESAWPGKGKGSAISNLWSQYYSHFFDSKRFGPPNINYLVALICMLVPIVVLLALAYCIYKKYIWQALFLLAFLFVTLSSGSLISVDRYALILAPIVIFLVSKVPRKNQIYAWPLVCIMACVQLILVAAYLQGSAFIG